MRSLILHTLSLFALQSVYAASLPQPAHDEVSFASLWGRLFESWWPFRSGSGTEWTKWAPERKYEDQVVLRFNISTVEEEVALRKAVDQMLLDVWDFTVNWTDIRIPNRRIRPLLNLLPESLREEHSILMHDVAQAVAATYPSSYKGDSEFESALRERGITPKSSHTSIPGHRRHDDIDDLFFRDYQQLPVIIQWMKLVDLMFSESGLVSMFSIGQSSEGRDIPALRVGVHPQGRTTEPRKTILITGGMHAREWISTSTVNYLAWSFVSAFGKKDQLATKILKEFDLVFVPVLNPDGYDFTWNVDRLWRKSRQQTGYSYCPGFDLDHAFGFRWDATKHQTDPCSESYGGDQPFQAVEASRLSQWAVNQTEQNNVNFIAYIDLHSYSQQILWPYAFSCRERVPNLENMMEVAMGIAKYMRLTTGEIYTVSSACEGVFAGSESKSIEASGGAAIDYFFHDLGAKYSYQIKLRDTGSYGFLLPSSNIIPTGDEVFQAMRGFGDYLLGNNGIERSFPQPVSQAEQYVFRPVRQWKA